MGDIWLPGLGPAYTDWKHLFSLLEPLMPTKDDATILAAIAGPESGFDWRVINDTPETGDYSVGLFEINYYASLYPSRVAAYGTPRELIESGPAGQCRAAANLWHAAGGFSPWAADIINNRWQRYVGSGPVPTVPGPTSPVGVVDGIDKANAQLRWAIRHLDQAAKHYVTAGELIRSIAKGGWAP